jgi:hypothetical protein
MAFKVHLIHAHAHAKIMTYVDPIRSSPKEKFAQYIRRTYSR